MLSVDRDALLCDMAETYRVYEMRALSVDTLAALAFGLRENSRIKQKLYGFTPVSQEFLLACIADDLTLLRYKLFGTEEDEEPVSAVETFFKLGQDKEQFGYASGEDFQSAWKELTEGTHG